MVSPRAPTDIQVRNRHLDQIRQGGGSALRTIDHLAIIIKDAIPRILIGAFLSIGEDLKSTFLRSGILPGLPNTIPYDVIRICRSSRIVLRQVPSLND